MAAGCSFYVVPCTRPVSATVLLTRHARHAEVGVVLSGRSEIALDAAGQDQATQLAGRFAEVPLAAVFASPRRRARQTAEAVAARHALPVATLDGLDEIDFGRWAGEPFAALDRDTAWQAWNAARGSAATAGGETLASATSRALAAIAVAARTAPVMCVTHCDIIRGVVAHVLGLDAGRVLDFDVDCASVTTLAWSPDRVRLIALNERLP